MVTGIATQGRYDLSQWITSYSLEYSDDSVTFEYYKEHGQSENKVKVRYSYKGH